MTLSELDALIERGVGAAPTYVGRDIGPAEALRNVAVLACVRILAETPATLPLPVYRRLPDGGKERNPSHPLYRLLHDRPNPEMTNVEFWEAHFGHLATWGNAYAEIQRNDRGPMALWPLRPDRMTPVRHPETNQLAYEYRLPDGTTKPFAADLILHTRGLGNNGIVGYSPIGMAREAIGLAMATEEYGARFFGNDSRPGGVLTAPGVLKKAAADNLKKSWEDAHRGLTNSWRVAVLEEGIKWQQVGIPPEDAQYLDTRKFQVAEIARLFRVPLHMIGELDRSTNNNIEHQAIEFVVHTIRPWCVRVEKRVQVALFDERDTQHYARFVLDGLLRGDIKSRYDAYAVARTNGWLSADDIRELEDMNPLPNGTGKIYLVPLNMVPADQLGQQEPAPEPAPVATNGTRALLLPAPENRGAGARRRLARAYRRVFEDAARRVVKREEADVMRQAEKLLPRRSLGEFLSWLEQFYRDHPAFVERTMLPTLLSLADATSVDAAEEIAQDALGGLSPELDDFMRKYVRNLGTDWAYSSLGQIRQVVTDAEAAGVDSLAALQIRFGEWQERRPGKAAEQHTVEASNAVALFVWGRGGITLIRWVTHGKNCPYCNALAGRVVGIDSQFVGKDEGFQPEGAEAPLRPSRKVRHAPAHAGCDCGVAPG